MPRDTHRPRKPVSARWARLLPFVGFRYSATRDAYVLRVVGNRIGPVYQIGVSPPRRPEPDQTGRSS